MAAHIHSGRVEKGRGKDSRTSILTEMVDDTERGGEKADVFGLDHRRWPNDGGWEYRGYGNCRYRGVLVAIKLRSEMSVSK